MSLTEEQIRERLGHAKMIETIDHMSPTLLGGHQANFDRLGRYGADLRASLLSGSAGRTVHQCLRFGHEHYSR